MIYKASLDRMSKIVTVFISLLFLCIAVTQALVYMKYGDWVSLAPVFLLPLIYVITYLYSPVCYKVEGARIVVHRPASDIILKRSDIKNIELLQKAKLKGTIRTFGVGGLFGYFGQFMNSEIGCMTWYATKHHSKLVLIEMNNGKKIVITPDEPEQFVHDLMLIA